MHRVNRVFLAVVVVLALLGGTAAVDFSRTLGDLDDAGLLKEQVRTELVRADVVDETFVLEARIHNPTRFTIQLEGAFAQVSDDGDRITYGSIVNHEELPPRIPADGTVAVRYEFALSGDQAAALEEALADGTVTVSGQHAARLHDTKFSIPYSGRVGDS